MSEPLDRLVVALADRYRIERELGAGGMATVYLAEDVKHHRQVAVKVLREDLTASLGKERFLREVTIAAGLTHPHILPLHDSGEADGHLFYVMPYVEGPTLRQRLLRTGELPIADGVRILRDIADAMAYAHKRGVVHRDLKPENVMLTDRHALVTDFGVAKALSEATGRETLTTAGVALGTPAYMSPEQATADPRVDQRSDIYSFGVLAYELLTGRTPFTGDSPQKVLAAHVTAAATPVTAHRASIPPALAGLVMRCLEKNPADRWQSAEELIPPLEALLTPSGGITPHETTPYAAVPTAGKPVRPRFVVFAGIGIVLVVLGALGIRQLQLGKSHAQNDRIVVAWLENHTGDSTLTDLGSLAAEWITDGLGREGTSTVIPSSAVSELMKGELARASEPITALANRTKASIVVTGRFDRRGDSLEYRLEARSLRDDRVIATVGPVTGGRQDTKAFETLFEQVLIALDLRRAWGSTVQHQRPSSLAAYREYMTGLSDHFVIGDQGGARPFFERAIALDSMWLLPRAALLSAYGNADEYGPADSLRARSQLARANAPLRDQLAFDWVTVRHDADYEAQYRIGLRIFELDPSDPYVVVLPAARTGRAREVLKYSAFLDTNLYFSRNWRGNYSFHLWALHALGRFDEELQLARQQVARLQLDVGTARWLVRPLAALGRYAEIDSLVALANEIPARGSSTAADVMWDAGAELLAHGWDSSQARRRFQEGIDYYTTFPSAERRRFVLEIAMNRMMLGDLRSARVSFDSLSQVSPENVARLGQLGAVAAMQGDAATANGIAERLASFDRPHLFGEHVLWEARIASLQGDCGRAAMLLRTALGMGQNYSNLTHHWWAAVGKARECKNLPAVYAPRD